MVKIVLQGRKDNIFVTLANKISISLKRFKCVSICLVRWSNTTCSLCLSIFDPTSISNIHPRVCLVKQIYTIVYHLCYIYIWHHSDHNNNNNVAQRGHVERKYNRENEEHKITWTNNKAFFLTSVKETSQALQPRDLIISQIYDLKCHDQL